MSSAVGTLGCADTIADSEAGTPRLALVGASANDTTTPPASATPPSDRAMSSSRAPAQFDETLRSHPELLRVTHGLRTPLTVIIGFCELLQDDPVTDAATTREFAARIAVNAWRLHAGVERLIEELVAMHQAGELPLNSPLPATAPGDLPEAPSPSDGAPDGSRAE